MNTRPGYYCYETLDCSSTRAIQPVNRADDYRGALGLLDEWYERPENHGKVCTEIYGHPYGVHEIKTRWDVKRMIEFIDSGECERVKREVGLV